MLSKEEAIVILQKHIDTYHVQLTDGGWEWMVKMGIAKNTIQEKILFVEDAKKQIQAYEMAIKALENSETQSWSDRCYLGSPCPYQHK